VTRAKKNPETTKVVWWEDLPQDFIEWSDREMAEADERHKRQQEKKSAEEVGKE
jgi:hypothetical protein